MPRPWTLDFEAPGIERRVSMPDWPTVRAKIEGLLGVVVPDDAHRRVLIESLHESNAPKSLFICIGGDTWKIAAQVELVDEPFVPGDVTRMMEEVAANAP